MSDDIKGQPTAEEIASRSGIMEGAAEPLPTDSEPAKPEAPKVEQKPEPKIEAKKESEEEDLEDGDGGEDESPDNGKEEEGSKPEPPMKPDRPLKTAFKQIGDLRRDVRELVDALKGAIKPAEKAATATVEDTLQQLLTEAKEKGADSDFLAKFGTTIADKVKEDLAKAGLLSKDLPKEVQDKLKILDELQSERKVTAETRHFEQEWTSFLPTLQKEFPNAKQAELAEASKLMNEISHSKEGGVVIDEKNAILKPYPLDYILFKNRDKFSAILKVAKGTKSGETGSREVNDFSESQNSDDIDLNPETMSPTKFKEFQKRQIGEYEQEKVQIISR